MLRFMLIALSILLIGCSNSRQISTKNSNINWIGNYTYFAILGYIADEAPIMQEISITISRDNDIFLCKYNEDGYQTLTRIICSAINSNDTLILTFKEWAPDNINTYPRFIAGDLFATISFSNQNIYCIKFFNDEYKTNIYIFEKHKE